jgi:uncharacterized lipoprotein YehR (DUF1307 family)
MNPTFVHIMLLFSTGVERDNKETKNFSHALGGDLVEWLKSWKDDQVVKEIVSLPLF